MSRENRYATAPTIDEAKAVAVRHRRVGVIILSFTGCDYAAASYGMTRHACDAMRSVVDQIGELIEQGLITLPDGFASDPGGEEGS